MYLQKSNRHPLNRTLLQYRGVKRSGILAIVKAIILLSALDTDYFIGCCQPYQFSKSNHPLLVLVVRAFNTGSDQPKVHNSLHINAPRDRTKHRHMRVYSLDQPNEERDTTTTNDSLSKTGSVPTNEIRSSNSDVTSTNSQPKEKEIVRKTWNPFRLAILRLKMTEPAMTSPLNYGKYNDGSTFHCAYCQNPLFDSSAKYNSGTGWPSFWRTISTTSVTYHREWDGRIECQCYNCKSHLGHVFLDGPRPSSIQNDTLLSSAPNTDPRSTSNTYLPRFCINGLALTYQPPPQDNK
jgi:peptide-methionine (R)-S-oxide reductase